MRLSPQRQRLFVTLLVAFFVLSAFVISGFTVATFDQRIDQSLPPNQAGGTIVNGSFEERDPSDAAIARYWKRYSNGQAWAAWYDETWREAVRTGEHAQLMEIYQVEPNILDRVIAIYQTVNVAPNSNYALTINAILRSQTQINDRNKHEVEMHWGVDFTGEGNYDNVETWNLMPLTEQFRLGSTGTYPEDVPLFYQTITGTIQTGNANRITLFIRGLKKFPTGSEVNFDVDDVSLVGSTTGAPTQPLVPTTGQVSNPAVSTDQTSSNLPTSGVILPRNISGGVLITGGLVLIALGLSAAYGVMNRKN